MSTPTIAVTGATGFVGGHVARLLAAAAVPQRLLVRTPANAPALPGAEVAGSSYADPAAARAALAGVDTLLMVSATESADRLQQHFAFIDAARAAGVRHVLYTSFLSAAPDAVFTLARDHAATEEHMRASGMSWTFLRDSFYLDFLGGLPGEDGVIRGPAGNGRVSAVTRVDVARSAAAVLQAPQDHRDTVYTLTGPEALTLAEVAQVLTDVRGTPATYHEETLEEAYRSREHYGAPAWEVDAWVTTYTAIAAGALASVTDDVEHLTGTPAMSLEQFLQQV